ncbi:MAG: hypothetical protein J6U54_01970 [Clostridiales bacterium]|nr:hypothetical protein [Clostridiales bacterium]
MKRKVFNTIILSLTIALMMTTIYGCSNKEDTETTKDSETTTISTTETTEAAETNEVADTTEEVATTEAVDTTESETEADMMSKVENDVQTGSTGRSDGERFESTIMLEGMEETVNYEHVIDKHIGIELDYEYESLSRSSATNLLILTSIYDDQNYPQNYLEITYCSTDAASFTETLKESLSNYYDVTENKGMLEKMGSCTILDTSNPKDTDGLVRVYIIPINSGCIVATSHFTIEAAEGFGARFANIVNTISTTDRNPEEVIGD